MRVTYFIIGLACITIVWSCRDIEDANPMERETFARFYESVSKLEGVAAKPVDGGYVLVTNSSSDTDTVSQIIRTDQRGGIIWSTPISNVILRSLVVADDGYFIFGDSIKVDPESDQLADLITYSALLYKINPNGSVVNKFAIKDMSPTNKIDFRASAATLNNLNQIVLLGTFKEPLASTTERPFLTVLDPVTLDTIWAEGYDVINRDYVNCKSVHCTSDGYIVWASAILREQQNFSRSYLSIPYIKEASQFENNDVFGSTTDQKLLAGDMQPAASPEFGYGVVGTYASPSGENSNMFFARVSKLGNFIAGSDRYFDGELSISNEAVSLGISESQDTGDAICSTSDGGFVLAGTMQTTPQRGNGGKDILLVKVDAVGNILWNRVIGGSGDETVNSIVETADGGLLICGSKDSSGLPAAFVIKTDQNGEIKN